MATDLAERLANYRSVLDDAIKADLTTRQPLGRPPARSRRALVAATAVALVVAGIGVLAWARSDEPTSPASTVFVEQPLTTDTDDATTRATTSSTSDPPEVSQPSDPPVAPSYDRLAIGDSVMLSAAGSLAERGFVVDAVENRHPADGVALVQALRDEGRLGSTVVVHFGTNGATSEAAMASLIEALAEVPHVLLVTSNVPREWTEEGNDLVHTTATEYPNATVLDWATFDDRCPGNCFYDDGIHLRPDGQRYYADLISAATLGTYVVQPGDSPFLVAQKFCTTISELVSANAWTSWTDFPVPDVEIAVPSPIDRATCPDPAG